MGMGMGPLGNGKGQDCWKSRMGIGRRMIMTGGSE
jgi:hypothetical protein